ncbi:MAG: hypothetical protein FDX30_03075 [Chlorobium sp.]|nr:MAG: hypothetical protein FDX30_03075 [Chlorobium sp.]
MKKVKPIDVAPKVCLEIAKNITMKIPVARKLRTKTGRTSDVPRKENLNRYVYDLVDKILCHYGHIKSKSILEI